MTRQRLQLCIECDGSGEVLTETLGHYANTVRGDEEWSVCPMCAGEGATRYQLEQEANALLK